MSYWQEGGFTKYQATDEQLAALKNALKADNTPFCAGGIKVSPDSFIIFYGKQKDARYVNTHFKIRGLSSYFL
jgi:hypothetical protein